MLWSSQPRSRLSSFFFFSSFLLFPEKRTLLGGPSRGLLFFCESLFLPNTPPLSPRAHSGDTPMEKQNGDPSTSLCNCLKGGLKAFRDRHWLRKKAQHSHKDGAYLAVLLALLWLIASELLELLMLSKAARAVLVEKFATVVAGCIRWCLKPMFNICSCLIAHEAHETQRTGLVNIGPLTSIGLKRSSPGDYKLLALMDSIKDVYFLHVYHFLEEGNKHSKRGKTTLVVRKNMWDLQCAQLRKFLELAEKHGASESDPRGLFGYHGTSAGNAEKIILEGFGPACRRCQGAGAFFSGMLEHSAGFARERGRCPGDILLVILLLDGQQMCGRHMYEHQHLRGHPDRPHLINVAECVFDEKYVVPLARLRGF